MKLRIDSAYDGCLERFGWFDCADVSGFDVEDDVSPDTGVSEAAVEDVSFEVGRVSISFEVARDPVDGDVSFESKVAVAVAVADEAAAAASAVRGFSLMSAIL